jgi:intracellular multiplication protein IcmE
MQSQLSTSPNLAGSNINNEKFALAASEAEAAAMQEKQKRITQMQSAMSQQAQSLIKSWDFVPMSHQGSVAPDKSATESAKEAKEAAEKKAESDKEKSARPLVKAGTVLFAVLETAVDSDYPNTPVMATIVNGKLKGAKLLGKLSGLSANQDKVSLIFTLIDKDEWDKTKTINAFAIDPDTARTVLASNVNYHYLMRYGSMFAASFVSGYANAIQSSGSTTTPSIFGTTTVSKPLSAGSKIAVGLGQIGTTLSSQVSNNFNTPPTVKVDAGVGIGILFMADLS